MSKTERDLAAENEELRRQLAEEEENRELRSRLEEVRGKKPASRHLPLSPRFLTTPVMLAVYGIVGAVVLAVVAHFAILPQLQESQASRALSEVENSRGAIRPANTNLVAFTGSRIEDANARQKALSSGDEPTTPPGFIFTNGKTEAPKRMDVYVDFAQQTSRDFFLLNQTALRDMVEAGAIELAVHPVPGGKAYSIYAAEAVAEAVYANPEQAWDFLITVMKLSAEVDGEGLDNDELAAAIGKRAGEAGLTAVDRESIQNGTFAAWLLSIGNDSRLAAGVTLPGVFLNDQPVNTNDLDLNDPDALREYVSEH